MKNLHTNSFTTNLTTNYMRNILIILLMVLLTVSCKKEDNTPEIYYEFSISHTTISEAMIATQTNTPLTPDFKVNSNGEGRDYTTKFELTKEELQQLNTLMLTLNTISLNSTYGIDRYTPNNTSIYEIKFWYKDVKQRTWINTNIPIPTELESIWNWYLSIQNSI